MDKRAVVESIMRNLDFDLETIPKHATTQEKNTTSKKTDPLNIKIRVKKKNNERCSQGFMTNNLSEPEMILRKVRLISSEKTIMSFDMFMEADLEDTTAAKPRKMFGSCLGGAEEDDGPYSKSDGKIGTQFPITKKTYDPFSGSAAPRRERTFLGQKCKPGGCLDPPFGEDRYAYMPHIQEPSHTQNIRKPHRGKPDRIDINNEVVREQPVKSPVTIDHMHIDDSTRPSATRTPDPIINIYKTESPKSSLIMYPPNIERDVLERRITREDKQSKEYKKPASEDKFRYPIVDHPIIPKPIVDSELDKGSKIKPMIEDKYKRPSVIESNVKKPRLFTEGDEGSIVQNKRTSEDKKYIIGNDVKPPRSRVSSENNENKFYNNRSSTEDKYRQSVNESMNSFFSPPKGIKRESSQRDSLKRHSYIPITENKPLENIIPPVADSFSLDSVPWERTTDSKPLVDTHIEEEKPPEEIIKQEPDQKLTEPQQMIPVIVPLPYPDSSNQIDKNVISDNIDLSNQKLKKDPEEVLKTPELSTSSSVNITFSSDLAPEQFEESNDEILDNPILPLEPEAITKDMTLFEKSPALNNQTAVSTDYEDRKEEVIEPDNKDRDIKPDDIIKKRDDQTLFEKIKEDDNQIVKDASLTSITKSIDNVTEQTELNSKQDLQKNASIQNAIDQDAEILNKPNLVPQPQQETIIKYEIPESLYPPTKLPVTSPKYEELHYETKPTEQIQKTESPTKKVDQPIKKDNEDNYIPDKVLISETTKNVDQPIKNYNDDNNIPDKVLISETTKKVEQPIKNYSGDNYIPDKVLISETMPLKPDIDKSLEPISYIPNIPKSHSPTKIPSEIAKKDEIKVSTDAERPLVTDIKKIIIPEHKTPETKDLAENKNKILPPIVLSDRDGHTVFLDLGFHSYLDNDNKRVLKTLDSRHEVKRYPNDSMAIINSPVQLPSETDHKFLIPIDSKHDMSIELKKRKQKTDLKDSNTEHGQNIEPKTIPYFIKPNESNVKSKSEVKDLDQHQLHTTPKTNENEQVRSKLTNIYEQELVPLQEMIRNLKQEIDNLAAQQTVYKKKVVCLQASTIPRIMHSNKRCSLYHCHT